MNNRYNITFVNAYELSTSRLPNAYRWLWIKVARILDNLIRMAGAAVFLIWMAVNYKHL